MLAALLAAACARQPAPADPPPAVAPEPRADLQPIATLAGEWRVAGIDGKPFDEPYGLALSADDKEIWWAPRCAGLIRTYRIEGLRFISGPPSGLAPAEPGRPGPAVCAIGLPPRLDEVTRAIDSATTIGRTENNGVELSGGGRSLLLFSQ